MMDLVHNLKTVVALAQGQVTATGNSTIVLDRQGFNSLMIVIAASAVAANSTSNYVTVVFQEGTASDGSDMADITDTRRYLYNDETAGTAAVTALTANGVFKIGLALGTKRYVRLRLVETGSVDVTITALAILGHPTHAPVVQ